MLPEFLTANASLLGEDLGSWYLSRMVLAPEELDSLATLAAAVSSFTLAESNETLLVAVVAARDALFSLGEFRGELFNLAPRLVVEVK